MVGLQLHIRREHLELFGFVGSGHRGVKDVSMSDINVFVALNVGDHLAGFVYLLATLEILYSLVKRISREIH